MQGALLHDESGDRKYFTQLPNMIVNHSTAYEQALYWQMKRFAGEKGICFLSLNEMSKRMGVHKTTVGKTIKKLLKRQWIREIDKKRVKGGYVRQFVIVDLWAINIKMYEGGAGMTTSRGGANIDGSGAVVDGSGAHVDTKNSYKEELKEDLLAAEAAKKDMRPQKEENEFGDDNLPDIDAHTGEQLKIQPLKSALPVLELLRMFEPVNPAYYLFTRNKNEIASIKRLRTTYGDEKLVAVIKALPQIILQPYAPRITSPYQLETNLGKLTAFMDQRKETEKKGQWHVMGQ